MFFPQIEAAPPANPFQKLRVPLLPDNYHPDRSPNSGNELETLDGAVDRQEILIVASHPEDVMPAAMTEVVGNDSVEMGIEELTSMLKNAPRSSENRALLKSFGPAFSMTSLVPRIRSLLFKYIVIDGDGV